VHNFRKQHPALTHDRFLEGRERNGVRDVVWLHQHGREMNHDDWSRSGQSVLGMHLRYATDEVLVWFNRHAESVQAILPPGHWAVGFISDDKASAAFTGNTLLLPPRSVVALLRAQIPQDPPLPEIPPTQEPPALPEENPAQIPPDNPNERPPAPVEEPPPEYPDEVPGKS
jgi:glycogen operon protein